MNWFGTAQTRVTTSSSLDDEPTWSSDGMKIMFSTNRDGNDVIDVMDANGLNQPNRTHNIAADAISSWR